MNPEENTTGTDLTLVDLQNLRSVIDIAARRGAFGAAEMSAVGTVYAKLDAFLNGVAAANQPAESEAALETSEPVE
jgi:hypothetical protein